jgi:RHS repeat-associated protein
MSTLAKETGSNVAHEKLAPADITITDPGYMYIYLSNESTTPVDVYFDDFKVTQVHSNVVAGADYYPFGLVMSTREITQEPYRYGYQGQFAEKDNDTQFNIFDLRMYDARIGRWISPDPYGIGFSPYIGMGNNPVQFNDPDGGCPWCAAISAIFGEDIAAAFDESFSAALDANAGFTDRLAMTGAGIGRDLAYSAEAGVTQTVGRSFDLTLRSPLQEPTVSLSGSPSFAMTGAVGLTDAVPLGGLGGAGALAESLPPIAVGIATAIVLDEASTRATERTYVTYTKTHPNGSVYVGRASGYGDPITVMNNRDRNHHMTALGYGAAQLDKFASGFKAPGPKAGFGFQTSAIAYLAIRGREQQLIDFYGGVGNLRVGNSIRGVAKFNPMGRIYHQASNLMFGHLAPYTGY